MECRPIFHLLVTAWSSSSETDWHTVGLGDSPVDVPDAVRQGWPPLLLELHAPLARHWRGHYRHGPPARPWRSRGRRIAPGAPGRQGPFDLVNAVLADLRAGGAEACARVLHLRWVEGRTLAETATALELEPDQALRLHLRARTEFRTLLARRESLN